MANQQEEKNVTVALVTGGNRGLGFETVRRLATSGLKTIVGARDPAQGDLAVRVLRDDGLEVEFVRLDATSVPSVRNAARQVEERYGRLDVLVNNAGILPEATASEGTGPVDVTMFKETFDTNLTEQGAETVAAMALVAGHGPSGSFVDRDGPISW